MERLSVPYQEDTVEYRIFIPDAHNSSELEQFASKATKFLHDTFIGHYIWQDEPFQLRLFSSVNHRLRPVEPPQRENSGDSAAALPNHLVGQTRFGDNLDDEWFIVFLLFELSRQFPNIFITVVDNDGQFMLIESALELPAWLDADTSENRVWIHRGQLCIIPPSHQFIERATALGSLPSLPAISIPQALEILSRDLNSCLALPGVSQCIQKRISGFPKAAHEANEHWTLCTLPLKVAQVLLAHPEAVAASVRGFYHRDPISLKDAVKLKRLGPAQPAVKMMVRFSRCLYAQLLRQEFHPPLIFGNQTKPAEKSPHHREYESWLLGSKLAVGMEISYNETRQKRLRRMASSILDVTPDSNMSLSFPFDSDEDWKAYKAKLVEIGFFQSQNEESPLYRSLVRKAKLKFLTSAESKMSSCFHEGSGALEYFSKDEESDLTYFDVLVDRSLATRGEQTAEQVQASCKLFDDSSSAWLDISPDEVDAIIRAREGKDSVTIEELKNASTAKKSASKAPADAGDDSDDGAEDGKVFDSMIRDMRSFMKGISGVEGVGDDVDQDDAMASLGPMDPKKFADLMRKTLGEEGIDVDDPNEEDDDFYAMDSDEDAEASDEEELSKESMRKLMRQMERELDSHGLRDEFERLNVGSSGSTASSSTSKGTKSSQKPSVLSTNAQDDEDAPIDVNLNLVKNFLESYGAQHGLSGPVSNILGDINSFSSEKKK